MNRLFKNVQTAFIAILLLAFCVRVARCFVDNRVDKDSTIYLRMAEDMGSGSFDRAFEWNFRMPPLYMFMMAAGEWIGLGAHAAGMIISVVAGSLLVWPVFCLGRKLFDERIGLLAAFLVATHPYLIRISADVMRDALFITLIVASLASVVAAIDSKRAILWYVAGGLTGLATMVRSESVEMGFVVLVWFWLDGWIHRGSGWKAWIDSGMNTVRFLVMALAVSLPVQFTLIDTRSTWAVVDPRVFGYVDNFFTVSAKDVIDVEAK